VFGNGVGGDYLCIYMYLLFTALGYVVFGYSN